MRPLISPSSCWDMPLQRFTVLPEPQSGHEHHIGSNNSKGRAVRKWINLLSLWQGQARMLLLVSNQANSNKQGTAQLTSEQEGRRDSSVTSVEEYGKCRAVVGHGKFSIVLVSFKKKENGVSEELYAVKKFQRQPKETERIYMRRSMSEFCVSSALLHPNVVRTLDLLKDAKGDYCEIMEFCTGGDLHSLVRSAGKLKWQEADCFFKQMMRGVEYIHEMGVAHLDLKPKNLLLTYDGLLKISDFGHSECVRFAWEKDAHRVSGIPNPDPYVAPEEYTGGGFDGYAVDIWACGVIYMSMITGRCLWRTAKTSEDASYSQYIEARRQQEGFEPIESLPRVSSATCHLRFYPRC